MRFGLQGLVFIYVMYKLDGISVIMSFGVCCINFL